MGNRLDDKRREFERRQRRLDRIAFACSIAGLLLGLASIALVALRLAGMLQ